MTFCLDGLNRERMAQLIQGLKSIKSRTRLASLISAGSRKWQWMNALPL
nr:MAG TPA: hypothetical protein [Caudoviricetes sp.]